MTEQPFYDDSFLSACGVHPAGAALQDYKLLQQQNMNLDFSDSYRNQNFVKAARAAAAAEDFFHAADSLKLASPELERLIIQNSNGLVTTTPAPAQYLHGRGCTEEQECFADGFAQALDDLHNMNQMHAPPNVSIGACALPYQPEPLEYTTLSSCTANPAASYPSTTISYLPHQYHQQHPVAHGSHHFQHAAGFHAQRFAGLKEEPLQTVPDVQSSDATSSPPMSPIDLEHQERVKAERKRLRNRLAATKCRKRKLERIARLEDKVKALKSDNAGLSSTASVLRDQVAQLKQKVLTHVSSGCQLMLTSKMEAAF